MTEGAHAILVLDQAGWHTSPKLRVPENISLLPLLPYAPELNPVEQVWAYLRVNFLSHRACCEIAGVEVMEGQERCRMRREAALCSFLHPFRGLFSGLFRAADRIPV